MVIERINRFNSTLQVIHFTAQVEGELVGCLNIGITTNNPTTVIIRVAGGVRIIEGDQVKRGSNLKNAERSRNSEAGIIIILAVFFRVSYDTHVCGATFQEAPAVRSGKGHRANIRFCRHFPVAINAAGECVCSSISNTCLDREKTVDLVSANQPKQRGGFKVVANGAGVVRIRAVSIAFVTNNVVLHAHLP